MSPAVADEELRIIREILARVLPQARVMIYGSRARGTHRRYSDLDLALMTERPLDLSVRAELSEAFSESDLPYRVDILDWASTSQSFRDAIQQDLRDLVP